MVIGGFRYADTGGSKAVLLMNFENEKGFFVKAMSEVERVDIFSITELTSSCY